MTRYKVGYDEDYQHEECDGGPMPMSEEAYKGNEYRACPLHPRAGTKVIDIGGDGRPQVQGCAKCGNTEYADIPYDEYVAYYGDPDRHVVLYVERQDKCSHCGTWTRGDATYGIDCMDDGLEARVQPGTYTLDRLPGYLREAAEELDAAEEEDNHATA